MIPGLTIKIVQGHDDIQVSTQDLAKLVDKGRVIGRVNGHMVTRFIPRGRCEGQEDDGRCLCTWVRRPRVKVWGRGWQQLVPDFGI